jgi:hypothetical protein
VISSRIRLLLGSRVLPGFLAPVVVAIVLGILGMHGIDAHGVNLHGPVTHAASATPTAPVAAGHDPAAVRVASNDAHSAGQATRHASSQSDDQTGGLGGSVMLCVAMLAGAAVALLAVLVRRGRLPKVWALLDPAGRLRAVVPAVLRVGTGPPAVWRFSVIRC